MKRKYYFLFLPILFCLIYACQEELNSAFDVEKEIKLSTKVEEAKIVFEALSPDFPCLQARSANTATKSIVIEPVWEGAFEDENEEYRTVESNIRLSKPLFMIDKIAHDAYKQSNDARYLNYLSRAVVLTHKKSGVSDAFIMAIIGSKEYMEKHDFQLWEVSYFNIPNDFSGMILYYSLNGTFVNGWQVKEDNQIFPCQLIEKENANLFSRSANGCYVVEVTNTYVDCVTYSGETFTTYEGEQYSNEFSETVCGEPYDETYTYLVCEDSNNTSGNVGGYSPPTSSNGRENYFGFIPQAITQDIDRFLERMKNKDCLSRAVLTYVDDYNLINFTPVNIAINPAKVDSVGVSAYYNPKDNTIYLHDSEQIGKTGLLYEELIHSIQKAVYTEEEMNIASFNMEFEAKLIIDYITLSLYSYGDTDLSKMATLIGEYPQSLHEFLSSNKGEPFDISAFFRYALLWRETTASKIYKQKNFSSLVRPVLIENLVNSIDSSCY